MWRTQQQGWVFRDRTDAGQRLAALLEPYQAARPYVLALPRGGVVVGYEVARAMRAPLDVVVARKLGVPGHRELGMGAVAPGGIRVIDQETVAALSVSAGQIERIAAAETAEMARRLLAYRGDRPDADLRDCTAIIVDDGLATGVSARAAVRSVRLRQPRRLLLAAPVCAPETAASLRTEVDDLVCVACPADFVAVGYWYRVFHQTSDEEVVALLDRARREYSEVQQPGGESQPPRNL